jgi:ABC-type tungstate transport system permease subunit
MDYVKEICVDFIQWALGQHDYHLTDQNQWTKYTDESSIGFVNITDEELYDIFKAQHGNKQ